jgi:hypothetical protein
MKSIAADVNYTSGNPPEHMAEQQLLIEGADLIDGTGGPVIPDAMVLIEGERIRYAGPRSAELEASPARRWKLIGKTLIPGLIEAHTHSTFDADMHAYIRNGITTLRFAGLDLDSVARLQQRIDSGELAGPRILSCGPMLDQSPPAYPEWSIAVDTPADAARAAERLIVDEQVDALIVTQRMTAPLLSAIVDVAHAHDRPVVGQTWALDGREAAECGIDELDNSSRVFASREYPAERLLHYTSIPDRLALSGRAWAAIDWAETGVIMQSMIDHGVSYCPLLVACQLSAGDGVAELESDPDFVALFSEVERRDFRAFMERLSGGWTAEDLDYWKRANENRLEWMRRFRELGGTLLVGTDFQWGGITMHSELRNLAAIGMDAVELIAAATGDCAKALRVGSEFGTISPGLLADIVVLERSPLEDLHALRAIAQVMRGGVI